MILILKNSLHHIFCAAPWFLSALSSSPQQVVLRVWTDLSEASFQRSSQIIGQKTTWKCRIMVYTCRAWL